VIVVTHSLPVVQTLSLDHPQGRRPSGTADNSTTDPMTSNQDLTKNIKIEQKMY
jgi:hypothetical protein